MMRAMSEPQWVNRIVGQGEEDPEQLAANPANWRIHPKVQQEALQTVLDEVGWVSGIIVNKQTGFVVDGHLRVSLALRRHDKTVPVQYVDLTEAEERLVLATLDPIAAMASTDRDKMAELLAAIPSDDALINDLLADIAKQTKTPFGQPPPDEEPIDEAEVLNHKWKVRPGDLWLAGEQRVVCGDCRETQAVVLAMGTEKAGLVMTDPPYGIGRKGITNDDIDGLRSLYDACLSVLPVQDTVIVAFQSPRLEWIWTDAVRAAGHKVERLLWLFKQNDVTFPWRGWLMNSEAIRLSSTGEPEWKEVHPMSQDTYIHNFGREIGHEGSHPSIKPLGVVQDIIQRVSGIVFDPFLGSGTTLVACEHLGRKGRGIEIEPSTSP